MFVILFCIVVLILLSIVGISTLKLSGVEEKIILDKNFVWISPLVGTVVSICIVQILNLILPVKIISIIYIALIALLLFRFKNLIIKCFYTINQRKHILVILFSAIILLNIPAVIQNNFISIQQYNNDIIYYLSSMDWLLNHSFIDKVIFSKEMPFYSCANYMVSTTRIGFDLLGSLLMSIFNLQAHEIFFVLSTISVILASLAFYFLSSVALKMSSKISILTFFLIIFSGNWFNLISYQYGPQILGIASFASFISFLLILYNNNYFDGIRTIIALFISSTVSVYSEFASYMLIIFIIVAIVYYIQNYRSIDKYNKIKYSIQSGFLSFIINPVGMYIGVKFNLSILKQVSSSISNVDPYNGKLMTIKQVIEKIFSIPTFSGLQLEQTLSITNANSLLIRNFEIVVYILLISSLFIALYRGYKKKNDNKYSIICISIFFIAYWIYFRKSGFAYGEFKHLTSLSPFAIIFYMYFIDTKNMNHKFLRLHKYILYFTLIFIILGNVFLGMFYYSNCNYFDDKLIELRNVVDNNYSTDVMTVDVSEANTIHRIVYALKEKNVKLLKDNKSYFNFFEKFDDSQTEYKIKEVSSQDDIQNFNPLQEKIMWKNSEYAITKNERAKEPVELTYMKNNKWLTNGEDVKGERIIKNNGVSYGPYTHLSKGKYKIIINGNNLNLCTYDVNTEKGLPINLNETDKDNNTIEYNFNLDDDVGQIEFRIFNKQEKNVTVSSIKIGYLE